MGAVTTGDSNVVYGYGAAGALTTGELLHCMFGYNAGSIALTTGGSTTFSYGPNSLAASATGFVFTSNCPIALIVLHLLAIDYQFTYW